MNLLTPEITEWFKNHNGETRSIKIYKGYLITHFTKHGWFKYCLWASRPSPHPITGDRQPVHYIWGDDDINKVKERAKNESI